MVLARLRYNRLIREEDLRELGVSLLSQAPLSFGYASGVICGDGHICINYEVRKYQIILRVRSAEFAQAFAQHLRAIGLRPNIHYYARNNIYDVVACSKLYAYLFKKIKKEKWYREYCRASRDYMIGFIRGFYDSEGSLIQQPYKGEFRIEMSNNDKELLDDISLYLHQLGIPNQVRFAKLTSAGNRNYVLGIHSYDMIRKFIEIIGSHIEEKRTLVQYQPKKRRYSAFDYLRALELKRAGYSYTEISVLTGIPRETLRDWLQRKKIPPYILDELKALGISTTCS